MHLLLLFALAAGLGFAQQTATQYVQYEPMVARPGGDGNGSGLCSEFERDPSGAGFAGSGAASDCRACGTGWVCLERFVCDAGGGRR